VENSELKKGILFRGWFRKGRRGEIKCLKEEGVREGGRVRRQKGRSPVQKKKKTPSASWEKEVFDGENTLLGKKKKKRKKGKALQRGEGEDLPL